MSHLKIPLSGIINERFHSEDFILCDLRIVRKKRERERVCLNEIFGKRKRFILSFLARKIEIVFLTKTRLSVETRYRLHCKRHISYIGSQWTEGRKEFISTGVLYTFL